MYFIRLTYTAQRVEEWERKPKHSTRSEMLARRRLQRVPDMSFDLDGDGTVSTVDFLIATKFDKDHVRYLYCSIGITLYRMES